MKNFPKLRSTWLQSASGMAVQDVIIVLALHGDEFETRAEPCCLFAKGSPGDTE
jgi:hypothetical protein